MKQRHNVKKLLILFESKTVTIKSIYRKKLVSGRYKVYLRLNEISESYLFNVENLDFVKEFKRGDLITLHLGNGDYISIEKGNKLPQDGTIRTCEI